jgi:septum formation protein
MLLAEHGFEFEVIAPSEAAECGICSRESPPELVARLAVQKSKDVAERIADGLVLGCDTVAECSGQILGKPADRAHAGAMLRLLRGQQHCVYSGLCLWSRPDDRVLVEVDVTQLVMDNISDDRIDDYLATDDWCGKAGAFGYQDGLDWVRVTSGSESNVVGLPMEKLVSMLDRFELEARVYSSKPRTD